MDNDTKLNDLINKEIEDFNSEELEESLKDIGDIDLDKELEDIDLKFNEPIDIQKTKELLKNKNKLIGVRVSQQLLNLFDKALRKDKQYKSRSDFLESSILRYLAEKKYF